MNLINFNEKNSDEKNLIRKIILKHKIKILCECIF